MKSVGFDNEGNFWLEAMSLLCPFQKSKDIASFYLAEAIVVTILECQYILDQEHTPNGSSVNALCGGEKGGKHP